MHYHPMMTWTVITTFQIIWQSDVYYVNIRHANRNYADIDINWRGGWKDYGEKYLMFLFAGTTYGNRLNNERPHLGVVANLRCKTSARYHYVGKMGSKMVAEIK